MRCGWWLLECLVGGLEHVLFFYILGIIIPTAFHIFQRGRCTTNQLLFFGGPFPDMRYLNWMFDDFVVKKMLGEWWFLWMSCMCHTQKYTMIGYYWLVYSSHLRLQSGWFTMGAYHIETDVSAFRKRRIFETLLATWCTSDDWKVDEYQNTFRSVWDWGYAMLYPD